VQVGRAIQIAVFSREIAGLNAQSLFSHVFGSEPESINIYPKPQGPLELVSKASASIDSVERRVQIQSARVDFIVQAQYGQGGLGKIENAVEVAQDICDRVISLPEIPQVHRLAGVVDLYERFEGLSSANSYLREKTGEPLPSDTTADFILQINERCPAKRPPFQINRLVRWTCESVSQLLLMESPIEQQPTSHNFYIASTIFDINTVPVSNAISHSDQAILFQNIMEEIRFLAANGQARKWSDA